MKCLFRLQAECRGFRTPTEHEKQVFRLFHGEVKENFRVQPHNKGKEKGLTMKKGQSSVEWLMTHAWAVLVVLAVGIAFFQLGLFQTQATTQVTGFEKTALQPVPDNIKFYTNGLLIIEITNTRPYNVEIEFIEVSPLIDKEDVIRTNIEELVEGAGYLQLMVNASNLVEGAGSSVLFMQEINAGKSKVDAQICMQFESNLGGKTQASLDCGEITNLEVSNPEEEDTCGDSACNLVTNDCWPNGCFDCQALDESTRISMGLPVHCGVCMNMCFPPGERCYYPGETICLGIEPESCYEVSENGECFVNIG